MLQPKRQKFRKQHKGRIHGRATRGINLNFGEIGLKAQEPGRVTAREIEAARRAINNYLKRSGKIIIRLFPDVPVTKKPIEVRMGKGKGSPEYFVAVVKPGMILFEVVGANIQLAYEALRRGAAKLSVGTRIVQSAILATLSEQQ